MLTTFEGAEIQRAGGGGAGYMLKSMRTARRYDPQSACRKKQIPRGRSSAYRA